MVVVFICAVISRLTGQNCDCIYIMLVQMWWTAVCSCLSWTIVCSWGQNCIYFLCVICCLFTGQTCDCIHFLLAQMWWTAVCSAEPGNPWKLSAHPSHAGPQVIYSKTVCKRLLQCDKLKQLGMVFVVFLFPPPPPFHFLRGMEPQREAGDVRYVSPVWNLSVVIGFPFLSPLSFFCLIIFLLMVHSPDFFPENSQFFFFS